MRGSSRVHLLAGLSALAMAAPAQAQQNQQAVQNAPQVQAAHTRPTGLCNLDNQQTMTVSRARIAFGRMISHDGPNAPGVRNHLWSARLLAVRADHAQHSAAIEFVLFEERQSAR